VRSNGSRIVTGGEYKGGTAAMPVSEAKIRASGSSMSNGLVMWVYFVMVTRAYLGKYQRHVRYSECHL